MLSAGEIKTPQALYQAMDKFLGNREAWQGDPNCNSEYELKKEDIGSVFFPGFKAIDFKDLKNQRVLSVADDGGHFRIFDRGREVAFDWEGNLIRDSNKFDHGNFNLFKPFMKIVEKFLASPHQYQKCTKPELKQQS